MPLHLDLLHELIDRENANNALRPSLSGITCGALYSTEGNSCPIMVQGDHGAVEFRTVALTPGFAESQ